MAIPEQVRSPALRFHQIKLIPAHDAHGHFSGGAAGNGSAGADDGGREVPDQAAEGGAGRGDGILRSLLGGTCGRGLRAVDALQAVGVVGVEGQRNDAAVHLQRPHL